MRERDELLRVRFAVSPLWETLAAVRSLADRDARRHHAAWHAAVAPAVARLELRPLLALQWPKGYVPDFLTPPPREPSPRFRDQVAELQATAPEQVERELRLRRDVPGADVDAVDELLADPEAARDRLAGLLHAVWRELVAPFWPRVRELLDRDVDGRSRVLAGHGLRRVLDELHPRVRWAGEGVVVDGPEERVSLAGRGLLLMPSAYIWPAVASVTDEPWQPTIVYPARGIGELWRRPEPPPAALERLLGATRAQLLGVLDRPLSTTALAALTELSPAGVSRHVVAMRDAGLLESARHGHEVRYARTPLGRELVAAATRAPRARRRRASQA